MTEILERRWRCNWCGCVSPVIATQEWAPKGWVTDGIHTIEILHFCCGHHEILWKNKRAESAETPEEAKV